MARAARAKTEPEAPQSARDTARQAVALLLFGGAIAAGLYGTWLGLRMFLSDSMPATAIWRFLGCAVVVAAIFTICVRIEPLPPRRKCRGNRWINIETPTQREIWETAPLDFVESIFAAVGIMATPTMLFIDFFFFQSEYEDFPQLLIATAVAAGAFALEGAFVRWRGRSMWDPPGQVRVVNAEPKPSVGGGEASPPAN